MNIIILSIICLTIILIILIVKYYNSKTPQYNCNHELDIIKTFESTSSKQYLSTCKKCGYQKTHDFTKLMN